MNRSKILRWVLPVSLALIALVIYSAYQYNRENINTLSAKPDIIISAIALATDFAKNEAGATEKYTGKLIEIDGPLAEINSKEKIVMIGDSSFPVQINCVLDNKDENISVYEHHTIIRIRGICTGYLFDVQLNNSVILNSEK